MKPGAVLVTGGAGFIGSHLVDRLVPSGWRVLDSLEPQVHGSSTGSRESGGRVRARIGRRRRGRHRGSWGVEDGGQSRDFVAVSDATRAIELTLDNDAAGDVALNVGTGTRTSVREVVGLEPKVAFEGGPRSVVEWIAEESPPVEDAVDRSTAERAGKGLIG